MKKLMIALTGILMSVSLAAARLQTQSGQNQDKQAAEGQTVEAPFRRQSGKWWRSFRTQMRLRWHRSACLLLRRIELD